MAKTYNEIPVIGFYGYSKSGKTSLIYRLISYMKNENIRVGVIKRTNKAIAVEPHGKDTKGFRAAGAVITSFASEYETNYVIPKKLSEREIACNIVSLEELDLIFIEGSNEAQIRKIRLGDIPKRENTVLDYNGDFSALILFIKRLL